MDISISCLIGFDEQHTVGVLKDNQILLKVEDMQCLLLLQNDSFKTSPKEGV
jgi:hypothetical protein